MNHLGTSEITRCFFGNSCVLSKSRYIGGITRLRRVGTVAAVYVGGWFSRRRAPGWNSRIAILR
jgi:hypothetical protein